MAYPFDGPFFPQAAPPFADPWAAPPMEMQAPDIMDFYEPPQMQSPPDDFFARLGQSQGPQPFQFQPRQGRNARGIDVILAALQGFGNARAAQGVQRTQQVQDENQVARENARQLAYWRHKKATEARMTAKNQADIEATRQKEWEARRERDRNYVRGVQRDKELAQYRKDVLDLRRDALNKPAASPTAKPVKLTAAQQDALANYNVILTQINDVKDYFKPGLVGPVRGRLGGLGQKAGVGLAPNESKLRSTLAAIRNTILNLRSGAAVTPQEADRLLQEIATTENAGPDFEDKLGQVERYLRIKAQTHRDNLEAAGADMSRFRPLPAERAYKYRSGASAGGGAGVASPAQTGRVRVIGPNGETGTIEANDVLPPGWRKQ